MSKPKTAANAMRRQLHDRGVLCMQGGGALQIGDLQFMVAGDEDGMMVKGALPKGTVRE